MTLKSYRRCFPVLTIAIAVSLFSNSLVSAAPISFVATGIIDDLSTEAMTGAGLSLNDAFTLEFTYDLSTPDSFPGEVDVARYDYLGPFVAPVGMEFRAGTLTVTADNPMFIVVANATDTGADSFQIIVSSANTNLSAPYDVLNDFLLVLVDSTHTALSSDALPTSFQANEWTTRTVDLSFVDGANQGSFLGGTIDNIVEVPEPTSSALALAALCLAVGRRRSY